MKSEASEIALHSLVLDEIFQHPHSNHLLCGCALPPEKCVHFLELTAADKDIPHARIKEKKNLQSDLDCDVNICQHFHHITVKSVLNAARFFFFGTILPF